MRKIIVFIFCLVSPLSVGASIGDVYYCIGDRMWHPEGLDEGRESHEANDLGIKLIVKWISREKAEIKGGTSSAWDHDLRIVRMDEKNEFFIAYGYVPRSEGKCAYWYCADTFQFQGDQFTWSRMVGGPSQVNVVWGTCTKF